ncbi:hypothetical protein Ssi03_58930 [Sphaerisporangium siamense]|nr:hypothetical protein Ssi03_58930 [Sphaerisporangium siamense]
MERRTLLQLLATLGAGAHIPASAIDALHSSLPRLTGQSAENSVEEWEQIAWDYAQGVWTEPPGSRFVDLAGDIQALEQRLARTVGDTERADLLRVYAQLTAFMALELADTSSARASWRSWRAARSAADAAGDVELRMWIRAREASESFYLRRGGTVADDLIEEVVHLAQGRAGQGLAEGLKTRARMLACAGRSEDARKAVTDLDDVFQRLPTAVTSDHISVWGVSLESVQFAQAYALTELGDTKAAMPMIEQAFAACPREKAGGRANMHLVQAWALVRDREVTEGLDHALDVTRPMPVTAARRRLVGEITGALPEKAHDLPAARELRALVAGRSSA